MNPYAAYQERRSPAWTRIDMLLALFDGAIERLDLAAAALERGDPAAKAHLVRARLLVAELAAGVDVRHGAVPANLLRLYEFAEHQIALGTPEKVRAALGVLRTLREGFQEIREEAVRLERNGEVPPAGAAHAVQALA